VHGAAVANPIRGLTSPARRIGRAARRQSPVFAILLFQNLLNNTTFQLFAPQSLAHTQTSSSDLLPFSMASRTRDKDKRENVFRFAIDLIGKWAATGKLYLKECFRRAADFW